MSSLKVGSQKMVSYLAKTIKVFYLKKKKKRIHHVLIDTENKLMVTKVGGGNQEFGMNMYTLLYIK